MVPNVINPYSLMLTMFIQPATRTNEFQTQHLGDGWVADVHSVSLNGTKAVIKHSHQPNEGFLEFNTLSKCDFPNIVKTFAQYGNETDHYLVLEPLDDNFRGYFGQFSLSAMKEFIEKDSKNQTELISMYSNLQKQLHVYFKDILSALEYLDTKSIYHMDITPQNIMHSTFPGAFKLIDFNTVNLQRNTSNQNVGKSMWQAPEILDAGNKNIQVTYDSLKAEMFSVASTALFAIHGQNSDFLACYNTTYKVHLPNVSFSHSETFQSFFQNLLQCDPSKRMTPTEALKHDYMQLFPKMYPQIESAALEDILNWIHQDLDYYENMNKQRKNYQYYYIQNHLESEETGPWNNDPNLPEHKIVLKKTNEEIDAAIAKEQALKKKQKQSSHPAHSKDHKQAAMKGYGYRRGYKYKNQ
eukprot:NODE_1083_length_2293_cov_0.438013.p1 type:complete len:412 gc:universal NODE_1083_length_2293_cov_0.438013:1444-209(-)